MAEGSRKRTPPPPPPPPGLSIHDALICTRVHLHKRTPRSAFTRSNALGACVARVIRGCHAAFIRDDRYARWTYRTRYIIARRRAGCLLCRNDDHWVTLTVNVNITDLRRGEWIVKSITRPATALARILLARGTSPVSFTLCIHLLLFLLDLPSNKFLSGSRDRTHTYPRRSDLAGALFQIVSSIRRKGLIIHLSRF